MRPRLCLSSYVARHPGSSGSSAANRFVDEALRMDEHPGVLFRDGRTGRRAVLVGGPDVREVIRAVKVTRAVEPDLDAAGIVALVETNTGVPARLIDTAIRYWSSYGGGGDHRASERRPQYLSRKSGVALLVVQVVHFSVNR